MDWRTQSQNLAKQFGARIERIGVRLARRRETLLVSLALTLVLVVLAGAAPLAALLGFALVVAWAGLADRGASALAGEAGDAPRAASERLWKQLLEGFPEPAVALGPSGHILYANGAAQDLLGGRRDGLHFTSLSRDPSLVEAVDRALANGESATVELQERVPVERRRSATIAALPTDNSALTVPAVLVTLRDLTEQDRLARMRADFVANASHELRTPLASLKGFVETLQGAAKDDPAARERFLAVMSEQADRMTRLIDDLLSLSRVEMREHLPPSDRVDVGEVLTHVVQSLQPLAQRSEMDLRLAGAEAEALVRGDRDELVQVFQNLIQNALKYGRRGGHVEVMVSALQGRVKVAVKDDGPGIAPQHLPRLTERFYRTSVAQSRERGGTGLGLAIVKHILNRHRGDLEIESKVGAGSTFTVVMPTLRA